MTAATVLPDHDARVAVRERLDATVFVEAGAGTGKTTALVGRLVALLTSGAATIDRLAAITFTEAAAAELRDRLRTALDDAAADAGEGGARAQLALAQLDGAAISTLHGFASRILSEHPFEAGLPPAFEVADEVRSAVSFDERWAAFTDDLLDDPGARRELERALVCGIGIGALRNVADAFDDNWDLLLDQPLEPPLLTPVSATSVVAPLRDAIDAVDRHCRDGDDVLAQHLDGLAPYIDRLDEAETDGDELEVLRLVVEAPRLACRRGQKGNWTCPVAEVRDLTVAAAEAADEVRQRATAEVLGRLVARIRRLTIDAAEARRRGGRLEFHDLLVFALALVRDHPEVCRRLRERYTHLLIDEFQDTDPIQAELAVRIAAGGDAPAGSTWSSVDWRQLAVPDGSLFFVGDPKQAIYRFRRADVALFLEVRERFGADRQALTANHRSVEGVVAAVNEMFERLIGDGEPGAQPAYAGLTARRRDTGEAAPVLVVGEACAERVAAVRAREAADVATVCRQVRDDGWVVTDGDGVRAARLADVCVLIPTRATLGALEDALDAAEVPYRVEARSLVYATPEVRDLVAVARAVDDPSDEVALVAALRSPLYACGDDDLVTFRQAGGRWTYLAPPPDLPDGHPVVAGLAALRQLHDDRWWLDLPSLLDRIITERRVLELALDARRPRDVWRRLRWVIDQARAYSSAYGDDLRGWLDWVDVLATDERRVREAVLPESDDDAVRIMTVHAAKGLEFPVVVLAGFNVARRPPPGARVLFGPGGPEVRLGRSSTPGFADLDERDRRHDAHEAVRLLYVAATRARDHLVISVHRPERGATMAHDLAAALESVPHCWRRWVDPGRTPGRAGDGVADRASDRPVPAGAPDPHADALAARAAWAAARAERLAAQRPRSISATAVAKLAAAQSAETAPRDPPDGPDGDGPDAAEGDDDAPWRRGRAGTALGRAVHAVLQVVDLATGDGLADLAASQAAAEGIPELAPAVTRRARAALGAPVVRQAAAGALVGREVYVASPVGDRLLEGFVDLVVADPDGSLVVVDHKTDAVADDAAIDARVEQYRHQAASYALVLARATNRRVSRAVFVFLRGDGTAVEREVADLDRACAEVERLLGGA